ncbi:hypothetical protein, partial [Nostoc sp.]|uniref:hypothetical protein n=1 Tax=Nostoc sp. TaxID=1180 RepID=UPI002FEF9545
GRATRLSPFIIRELSLRIMFLCLFLPNWDAPVGGFVETKTFRLHTGIAGIFHCLGVNDDQRRPVRFFFTCSRTSPCKTLISSSNTPAARH